MQLLSKNSEQYALLDLERMGRDQERKGYYLIFHLSRLAAEYKSEFQFKVAANILNDIFRDHHGTIYMMDSGDIFVLAPYAMEEEIEEAIYQLKYLFHGESVERDALEFCQVFNLRFQFQEARVGVKKSMILEMGPEDEILGEDFKDLSMSNLAQIDFEISKLDLRPFIRIQTVAAFAKQRRFQPIFYEFYLHVPMICEKLKLKKIQNQRGEIYSLFKASLNRRLLNYMLSNREEYFNGSISFDVDYELVASNIFSEFCKLVPNHEKSAIVLEFALSDVIRNLEQFYILKQELKAQGFRILIEDIDNRSFEIINFSKLMPDLIKLNWNLDLEMSSEKKIDYDQKRIILKNCDSRDIVETGLRLDLALFQGNFIERILKPQYSEI